MRLRVAIAFSRHPEILERAVLTRQSCPGPDRTFGETLQPRLASVLSGKLFDILQLALVMKVNERMQCRKRSVFPLPCPHVGGCMTVPMQVERAWKRRKERACAKLLNGKGPGVQASVLKIWFMVSASALPAFACENVALRAAQQALPKPGATAVALSPCHA